MRTTRLCAVWALGTLGMVYSAHSSAQDARPAQPNTYQDFGSRTSTGTTETLPASNPSTFGPVQTGATNVAPPPLAPVQPTPPVAVAPAAVPAIQPAVAPVPAAAPAAPAPAPASPESTSDINKSGTVGFGAALLGGSGASPVTLGSDLNLRIWVSDMIALQPSLVSNVDYDKTSHTTVFKSSPQLEVVIAAYRRKANRINVGIGAGYGMQGVHVQTTDTKSTDTSQSSFFIPVELQLEHFFASWFSLQVGTRCTALRYTTTKPSTGSSSYSASSAIDSTVLKLGFMFYTD